MFRAGRGSSGMISLTRLYPYTICISIVTSYGFHKSTISILQFCRSKRNFSITSILNQLVCYCLCTSLNLCDTGTRAINISTTCCRVNITSRSIYSTIYLNRSIYQIFIRTIISSARSILNRQKGFINRADKVSPLLRIIYIDVVTTA